jgi:hypothetical protein
VHAITYQNGRRTHVIGIVFCVVGENKSVQLNINGRLSIHAC